MKGTLHYVPSVAFALNIFSLELLQTIASPLRQKDISLCKPSPFAKGCVAAACDDLYGILLRRAVERVGADSGHRRVSY